MRVHIVVAVAIFALALAAPPAMAFTEISIPFVTTDCVTFTFPNANTALTILEFNSASTSAISLEKFDMDFPVFTDGIVAGPVKAGAGSAIDGISLGAGASANVIPFGPVNLALPSITQTTDEIIASQQTYFFTDTFG